jgi:hypothetical protein
MGECVIGMGQRSNYAAVKDVQIKLRKEECAKGTYGSNATLKAINQVTLSKSLLYIITSLFSSSWYSWASLLSWNALLLYLCRQFV